MILQPINPIDHLNEAVKLFFQQLANRLDKRVGAEAGYWVERDDFKDLLRITVWANYVGEEYSYERCITVGEVLKKGNFSFLDETLRFLEEAIGVLEKGIRARYAELCQVGNSSSQMSANA